VAEVAIVASGQAAALQPDLVRAQIEYTKLNGADMGSACAQFQLAVRDGSVVHVNQDELTAAVANAHTRRINEVERWDRADSAIDISPLVAVSAAVWRHGLLDSPLPAIY
jgi:hypothetical protein